jgi:isopenicillin N synthase-like dioxygenase
MAHSSQHTGPRTIPTVDLSPFTTEGEPSFLHSQRLKAGQTLVEALHNFGFAKVTGHGVSKREIDEAFGWAKKLFDLPKEDKMKAPHPAGPMPHRGYSGIGQEKGYSQADVEALGSDGDVAQKIRDIPDFKVRGKRAASATTQPHIFIPPIACGC